MKVLHLILRLAEIDGGPPRGLLTLANAQVRLEQQVTILPCSSTGGKMVCEPGQYGRLTVLPPASDGRLLLYDSKLKKILQSLIPQADIIHIHGSWRYHLQAGAREALAHGKPYIVRPAGNLGRVPRKSKWMVKKAYFELFERRFLNKACAIHCCTKKEQMELADLGLSPPSFIVPQPVENDSRMVNNSIDSLGELCPGLTDDAEFILYLGRIGWIKRLPLLLEAFTVLSKECENLHLVIAGPWEEPRIVKKLRADILKAGLQERVHLPGMVQGQQKQSLMRAAKVFVQPSAHENFGISVAEALTFGRPCVVSRGVGLAEDLSQGKAGLVFEDDSESLVRELRKLLLDTELLEQCEQNARRFSQNFSPAKVAQSLQLQYEQCLK